MTVAQSIRSANEIFHSTIQTNGFSIRAKRPNLFRKTGDGIFTILHSVENYVIQEFRDLNVLDRYYRVTPPTLPLKELIDPYFSEVNTLEESAFLHFLQYPNMDARWLNFPKTVLMQVILPVLNRITSGYRCTPSSQTDMVLELPIALLKEDQLSISVDYDLTLSRYTLTLSMLNLNGDHVELIFASNTDRGDTFFKSVSEFTLEQWDDVVIYVAEDPTLSKKEKILFSMKYPKIERMVSNVNSRT